MGETAIPWATKGWSPVLGCTEVSEGCQHCYARRTIWRVAHNPNPKLKADFGGIVTNKRLYIEGDYEAIVDSPLRWTGLVRTRPDRVSEPAKWKQPERIFVCPMADLFHESVPDDFIRQVWNVLWNNPRHRFIILTKRPERLLEWSERREIDFYDEDCNPLPALVNNNGSVWPDWCWLGVSAENQDVANQRIPVLLQVSARHHWVSCEPILGKIDLLSYLTGDLEMAMGGGVGIEWVVAGAESGTNARPDDPDWYLSLIEQCGHARVPLFVKQARAGGRLVKMPAFANAVIYDEYPKDLTLPSDYAFGGIVRPHTR